MEKLGPQIILLVKNVTFSLIWHFFWASFQLLMYIVWLRITDEGLVPEMRIWSIILIKSDLKWCIHLSRSLFNISACMHMIYVVKEQPRLWHILTQFSISVFGEYGGSSV